MPGIDEMSFEPPFDLDTPKLIHKNISGDVYDQAGTVRRVDVA